jgi:hypothetical protein
MCALVCARVRSQKRIKADRKFNKKLATPKALAAAAGRCVRPFPSIKRALKELRQVREIGSATEALDEEEASEDEEGSVRDAAGDHTEDAGGEDDDAEDDDARGEDEEEADAPPQPKKTPKKKPQQAAAAGGGGEESDDSAASMDSDLRPIIRRAPDLTRVLHKAPKRPGEGNPSPAGKKARVDSD